MLTAPYVSEVTEKRIFDFFKSIAPLGKTGIVIYNMPEIGYVIPPHLLEKLVEIPNIIGLKQGDPTPKVVDRTAFRRFPMVQRPLLYWLGPFLAIAAGHIATVKKDDRHEP
jgi:4-hydroxy-tetrahydrodipicolinate synthase